MSFNVPYKIRCSLGQAWIAVMLHSIRRPNSLLHTSSTQRSSRQSFRWNLKRRVENSMRALLRISLPLEAGPIDYFATRRGNAKYNREDSNYNVLVRR